MKIVIIDDEQKARSLLINVIQRIEEHDFELFEAADLASGVKLIKREQPKLVFLDIEMPNEQGTEILNYFDPLEVNFDIVFATAYSEYALRAFEMNAIDYILKPIRPKKIIEIVKRIHASHHQENIQQKLQELKASLTNNSFDKIGVPVQDGLRFLKIETIVHLEADGMYTKIFTSDNTPLLISKPLKFFNRLLETADTFYKPHRSHIINLRYLKQYIKKDGNYAVLENDNIIPISKDKREEFVSLISII